MRAMTLILAALVVAPTAAAAAVDCASWQAGTDGYITLSMTLGKQSAQQHDAGNFGAARELRDRQGLVLRLVRQREEIARRRCVVTR